jgi:hypothetical protein
MPCFRIPFVSSPHREIYVIYRPLINKSPTGKQDEEVNESVAGLTVNTTIKGPSLC